MKKFLALLAVAALLSPGSAVAGPDEDVRAAAKFVVNGNKEAAIPLLEGVLADGGAPAEARAQAYYVFSAMESDPMAAVPFLDKSIAADPTFLRAHVRKTEKLYEAKKYAEAAEAATTALGLDPANKQMLQYRAYSYYNVADYPRAVEAFSACLRADNRNGSLYLLRGHSHLLSHQQDKALEDFNLAGRYASQLTAQEQVDIQYYRGLAYLDTERFDLAVGSFNRALGMSPSAERKADLERLLAETTDKKAVHEAMAQTRKDIERAKRNPWSSVALLQKTVENPDVTDELKAQAYDLLSQTGQTSSENLAYADKAVELAPQNSDYLTRQGILRFVLGESKEAVRSFDLALALDQASPLRWMYRGLCYLDLQDWGAAEKDFSKAAELQPGTHACYLYRARAHFMLGNMDSAREDMKKVPQDIQRLNKSLNAEYNYVRGLFAQYDKQYGDALKYYARALNADASGSRGQDLQKRKDQLESLNRWIQKR